MGQRYWCVSRARSGRCDHNLVQIEISSGVMQDFSFGYDWLPLISTSKRRRL